MLYYVSPALLEYSVNGRAMNRIENKLSYASPHGVYRCKGEFRWCAIAVFSDEEWKSLCKIIGNPDLARDAELATINARINNADMVDKMIEEWTKNYSAEEVMKMLQDVGVAAGVVKNGEDLCKDPQMASREFYYEVEHPTLGRFTYSGLPVRMSETPYMEKRSPCFGEHNEYVCRELLRMPDEEFIELMQEGVFE
jgi:crotonobetainyl-CoA:carnitine CoA-transferase CaiB-like acyl-CoA transferase